MSLEEAIRNKYCCQEDEEDPEDDSALPATRLVKEAAVYLRPGLALSLNSYSYFSVVAINTIHYFCCFNEQLYTISLLFQL